MPQFLTPPSDSMHAKLVLCGLLALSLAISCEQNQDIITIITDMPEVAEYLEFVRDEISPPHFRVLFNANIDKNAAVGEVSQDIIISSRIAYTGFSDYLYKIPLSQLNKQEGNSADNFVLEDIYPSSYEPYIKDGAVTVLPLAFDLPIVYFDTSLAESLEPYQFVSADKLLEIAAEQTELRRNIYATMGFSSLRNILFIDLLIRDQTNVRANIPPPEDLKRAMENISEYLKQHTQDPYSQVYYNDVFAYSVDHASMREGYLHASLSSFYAHIVSTDSPIHPFPYVWLYSGNQIEALHPVFIGISRGSRNKRQGINIARRLLSADVQARYLKKRLNRPFDAFLFRLSSNRIINEHILSQLLGTDNFSMPRNIVLPSQPIFLWDQIKTEVYYPWIMENLISQEISTDDLYQNLESYYKLNGNYH